MGMWTRLALLMLLIEVALLFINLYWFIWLVLPASIIGFVALIKDY